MGTGKTLASILAVASQSAGWRPTTRFLSRTRSDTETLTKTFTPEFAGNGRQFLVVNFESFSGMLREACCFLQELSFRSFDLR